jgi:hypothetical protein
METWMNDQYSMFGLPTSEATTNATSSPESEDGATPCASPDGPMTGQSGQEAAHVSRFRARDSEKAMPTNDTSGPLFTTSSPSASLQRSLENRLVQNLDLNGSVEYALTWKVVDMPAGPPIYRLRASAHRTSGKEYGGWATPNTMDHLPSNNLAERKKKGGCTNLKDQVAGWPTPMATTGSKETPEQWRAREIRKKAENPKLGGLHLSLDVAVQMTGWPTPTDQDNNQVAGVGAAERHPKRGTTLGGAVRLSPAQTEKPGALNPAFSLWLMGYPTEWASCGARATRLSRKPRRNS